VFQGGYIQRRDPEALIHIGGEQGRDLDVAVAGKKDSLTGVAQQSCQVRAEKTESAGNQNHGLPAEK